MDSTGTSETDATDTLKFIQKIFSWNQNVFQCITDIDKSFSSKIKYLRDSFLILFLANLLVPKYLSLNAAEALSVCYLCESILTT